jgi:methyl-accepting chemotaxis protein
VALYLFALLQLTSEQWREFLIAGAVFAALSLLAQIWMQRRFDRAVVACIDAQRRDAAGPGDFRSGFQAVMALPRRMLLATQLSWTIAAIAVPGWMMLRLDDFSGIQPRLIAMVALMGGLVTAVFVFFVLKRLAAPLRDSWASRLPETAERRQLIRRLSLSRKLGIAVSGVMVSTVFAAALLSYSLAFRPIEAYSTRVQSGFVGRMARRVVGPQDPLLGLAKDDLGELGIAGQLLVVDLQSGQIVHGPRDALTASEIRWIAASEGATGTILGIDSDNSFAWSRIEDDESLALVAVTPRDLLIGDLGRVQLVFGLLLLAAFAIALVAAFLMAGDVSRTTEWLRREAGRIASGNLTRGEVRESEDELGDLARSFEDMSDSLRETVKRVADAAERVDAEAIAIARVGLTLSSTTVDQVQGIELASQSMAAINGRVSGIVQSAQALSGNVEEASSSLLELSAAGDELNHTASSLLVSRGRRARSDGPKSPGSGTEGWPARSRDLCIDGQMDSVRQVEQRDQTAASPQVVSLAERGRERVQQTIAGMHAIREATNGAELVIRGLGDRVQEIGAIVDVIDDVADETNLLALNAAIIAAQAGDQGRAFSVVADEIKDLADRVLPAPGDLALIRLIQRRAPAVAPSSTEPRESRAASTSPPRRAPRSRRSPAPPAPAACGSRRSSRRCANRRETRAASRT